MNYIRPVCGFDKLDEPAYDEYNEEFNKMFPTILNNMK